MWQKQSLFEESARVPLLIAAPGSAKGATAQSPVGLIDLYPTLAELCGVKAPGNLQGQSLVPMLKNPEAKGRGWTLSQVVRGGGFKRMGASAAIGDDGKRIFGYTLRAERWRYTEWDEGRQGRELYDHAGDPKELTNLADQPDQAGTVARLSTQLRAAVKASFPKEGVTPKIPEGNVMWAPLLVDP